MVIAKSVVSKISEAGQVQSRHLSESCRMGRYKRHIVHLDTSDVFSLSLCMCVGGEGRRTVPSKE